MKNSYEKINDRSRIINSMVGVWLDTLASNIPEDFFWSERVDDVAERIFRFNEAVMTAVWSSVVDVKVNSSFYMWSAERTALKATFQLLRDKYPHIFTICDGKFGDVGHTSEELARYVFDELGADAIMVNPYMGSDSIDVFSRRKDKGVVVCVNTSNPTAGEVQELMLENGLSLWQHILTQSMGKWNVNWNIIPVLSSTHPANLAWVRGVVWDAPIVLAGAGLQGWNLSDSLPYCIRPSDRKWVMISSSRWIIHAPRNDGESYTEAMQRVVNAMREEVNKIAW